MLKYRIALKKQSHNTNYLNSKLFFFEISNYYMIIRHLFSVGLLVIIHAQMGCDNIYSSSNSIFTAPPDTTNMLYLVNYTDKDIIKSVIEETTYLENGKVRNEGIIYVPLDYDDFKKADIDEVYWNNTSIIGGDFRGASFRSAHCDGANFSNSDFRFCDVRWTDLNNSTLTNCDFSRATLFRMHVNDSDLEGSDFRGANMFGVIGHRSNFRNCDFTNSLMKESEFTDADFTGSIAVKVKFIITVFAGAKMDSTDLSYTDFTGAGLEEVSFINARIIEGDFRGAHLQEANFTGADLKGCNFFAAEFVNTIFSDAINIPEGIKELIVDGKITGVCSVGGNDD